MADSWLGLDWTAIGAIISGYLTWKIIKQTERIDKNQTQLQKRQIKIELFSYRQKVYEMTLNIYTATKMLKSIIGAEDYNVSSLAVDASRFNDYLKSSEYKIDLSVLQTSSYMFSPSIYKVLNTVHAEFMILHAECIRLEFASQESPKELNESLNLLRDSICKISDTMDFIKKSIPDEINIANLDK